MLVAGYPVLASPDSEVLTHVHIRAQIGNQYVAMGGTDGAINYDLANTRIESISVSDATGSYRDERLDIFLRGGNISLADNNVEITDAELVNLRYRDNNTISEVYCIGSWNVSQKVGTTKTNQTEEI